MKKSTIRTLYLIALPASIVLGIIMIYAFIQYNESKALLPRAEAMINLCHFPKGDCDPEISGFSDLPSACTFSFSGYQLEEPPTCEQALNDLVSNANGSIATAMLTLSIGALLSAGCSLAACIAWIGALVNLARAQEWGWFWGVLLASGIAMLIYIFVGPEPLTPEQAAYAKQQRMARYVPIPQQSSSALTILQERYARGEIDTATYQQMRAQLER